MIAAILLQAVEGSKENPLHVVQDTTSILPLVLSFAVVVIPIATFLINHYRDAQARRGSSYSKLVVEPSLGEVTSSFDEIERMLQLLAEAARLAGMANRPYQVGIRRRLAETYSQVDMLENRIADRLGIIGFAESHKIAVLFQELRDSIANFGDWAVQHPAQGLDIRTSLVDHKRNILGALYEREFHHFEPRR